MRELCSVLAGVLCVLCVQMATATAQETTLLRTRETLVVGGVTRTYILRVPARAKSDAAKPKPLVILLHGRGGNGAVAERSYGWDIQAEKVGAILVCPDALGSPPAWNSGYNSGRLSGTDDAGFLRALIGEVQKKHVVDAKRIYVCGHSSGGMMSHLAGAELGDLVAAIGVVAGSVGRTVRGETLMISKPKQPVSAILFHSKADDIVPYDHKTNPNAKYSQFLPAPDSALFWAKANGTSPTPKRETMFAGNIVREAYEGGEKGTDVVFYTLGDGGHFWPGGRSRLRQPDSQPNRQINATELMWEFFEKHPKR